MRLLSAKCSTQAAASLPRCLGGGRVGAGQSPTPAPQQRGNRRWERPAPWPSPRHSRPSWHPSPRHRAQLPLPVCWLQNNTQGSSFSGICSEFPKPLGKKKKRFSISLIQESKLLRIYLRELISFFKRKTTISTLSKIVKSKKHSQCPPNRGLGQGNVIHSPKEIS